MAKLEWYDFFKKKQTNLKISSKILSVRVALILSDMNTVAQIYHWGSTESEKNFWNFGTAANFYRTKSNLRISFLIPTWRKRLKENLSIVSEFSLKSVVEPPDSSPFVEWKTRIVKMACDNWKRFGRRIWWLR